MLLLSQARLLHGVVLDGLFKAERIDKYVKPGMGPALFALFDGDGLLMKELMERTGMAASSVTEVVRRMEKSGLVKRVPDATDGRAVRLHLTPRGHEVKPRVLKVAEKLETIMQGGLAPAEVKRLTGLLHRVICNLQSHLQESAKKGAIL